MRPGPPRTPLLLFPPLKTPARDGRRRRRLHAPARCSSYLTAAAWSVGRASGRSSPAAAPAGCAPRPRPRALPRLGPLATRAAAAPVRMRIRDPAGERAPAARPVAPVRPCPRSRLQAERLGPPRGARAGPRAWDIRHPDRLTETGLSPETPSSVSGAATVSQVPARARGAGPRGGSGVMACLGTAWMEV